MITGCDTMVALGTATTDGQTIFAKNSDRPQDECQPLVQRDRAVYQADSEVRCQFVSLPQVNTTYRHVGSRPFWCWGYEHGFNEHQVVIGNEGLTSKIEHLEPKLVGMEVLRLGLERARTAGEAVEVITDTVTRHGQGKFGNSAGVRTYDNGYLVADPHEAYVIETVGHEWAVKRVESALGISNVYSLRTDWDRLSPDAEAYAAGQGWWGEQSGGFDFGAAYSRDGDWNRSGSARRVRSCALLDRNDVDVSTMMSILRDHFDESRSAELFGSEPAIGTGICMHSRIDGAEGRTAASLVADLCADSSRLPVYWCGLYSPCMGVFFPVFIEGKLPAVLAVGDAEPSIESPWWLFHQLSRAVAIDPEGRAPAVRDRWSSFQSQLVEAAYPMAHEARRLIDDGQDDAASRILSDYMNENVRRMLSIVSEMLESFGSAVPAGSAKA